MEPKRFVDASGRPLGRSGNGADARPPINHVSEELLIEVAELLVQLTRHPKQAVGRKQLLAAAEKAIAENYIYQRRLQTIAMALNKFKAQADTMPEDAPLRKSFEVMFNFMKDIIEGRDK